MVLDRQLGRGVDHPSSDDGESTQSEQSDEEGGRRSGGHGVGDEGGTNGSFARGATDFAGGAQWTTVYDYHAHTNYSDGRYMFHMARAAAAAGIDGIGFTDHCTVTERAFRREERARYGFNLDETYERRRTGIESLRAETDVAIYDGVEMDYHPSDEDAIADFLAEADFDYAIGSVHELDGANVQVPSNYAGRSEATLDALVDEYFDRLVELIESELFDVAAHPDLIERTPPLAGRATEEQYRRVAAAFADSRTIPEINTGRALTDLDLVHPTAPFRSVLAEYDVSVTVGSDSHTPDEIEARVPFLRSFFEEAELDPVAPPALQ
nr:PHP domain-containing protein [Halomicrobium mukohataei]